MGLDFLAHAYMNEVLAYAVGAASLFGVVAPNSGNQTILVKYGTEEQKQKWLLPLIEGTMESGFSMTEPRQRRLGPALARRPARARRRRVGDQRPQVVHLERHRRRLLHRHVPRRRARRAAEPRRRTMAQIIVPTRHAGREHRPRRRRVGPADSDHCEIIYDDVRVPVENQLGRVGDGPPGGAGPPRRRPRLPLHELGRPDVAGVRPDGRAGRDPRGARRPARGQAVHAGLHRRQLHRHPGGAAHDDPRRREDRPRRRRRPHRHLGDQGLRARRRTTASSTARSRCGARPASRTTCRSPACTRARARCASPTARTRCTRSSSPRTCSRRYARGRGLGLRQLAVTLRIDNIGRSRRAPSLRVCSRCVGGIGDYIAHIYTDDR